MGSYPDIWGPSIIIDPPAHSAAVSPLASLWLRAVKNPPAMVRPGSILVGKIPGEGTTYFQYSWNRILWTEEPGRRGSPWGLKSGAHWGTNILEVKEGGRRLRVKRWRCDDASRGWERGVAGERLDHTAMALKVEGTTSQGMQAAFRIQKKPRNPSVPLEPSRRHSPANILIFLLCCRWDLFQTSGL